MPTEAHVQQRISESIPGASVDVTDYTGGGDHFRVSVVSAAFDGLSRVDQHRLVYAAVQAEMADGSIHALSLATSTPEQAKESTT